MADIILGEESIKDIKMQIIGYIIMFIVVNVFTIIAQLLVAKLFNRLFTWIDKRKMDNYSLYEWSGEPVWLEFHEQLSSIKKFNPKSLSKNYERIKVEIKSTFNNGKKLNAFKVYLEVQCDSPRLNSLLNSTQSIFVAIITFSLVTLVNFTELTQTKNMFFVFIFIIVWLGLLMVIDRVSKQIDRNKVFLKLVSECIEEEKQKGKNKKS
jgi:hypothetical protein